MREGFGALLAVELLSAFGDSALPGSSLSLFLGPQPLHQGAALALWEQLPLTAALTATWHGHLDSVSAQPASCSLAFYLMLLPEKLYNSHH